MKRINFIFLLKLILFVVVISLLIINLRIQRMLLDDGYETYYVQTMINSLSRIDIKSFLLILLEEGKRFRPVFWLYYMVVWLLGGPSLFLLRFTHVLIFALLVLFIYLFIKKTVNSNLAPIIATFYFLLSNLNTENLMRIGPQEPLMSLFALLTFYSIFFKKNIRMIFLFIFLTIFTKENGFGIIPGIFAFTLIPVNKISHNVKDKAKMLMFSLILFFITILPTLLNRQGYSADYISSPTLIFNNLLWFIKQITTDNYLLIIPSILTFVFMTVRFNRLKTYEKNISYKIIILGCVFVSFIVIQSPWKHLLTRYLFPSTVFLSIIIGILFGYLESIYKKYSQGSITIKILNLFFWVLFFYFIVTRFIFVWFSTVNYIKETNLINKLTAHLAKKSPLNSEIFVNLQDSDLNIEKITELEYHEHLFYGRTDLKVSYVRSDLPLKSIIVDTNSGKKDEYNILLSTKLSNNEAVVFEDKGRVPIFTKPEELIKKIIKNIWLLISTGSKPDLDGIFTYYIYEPYWKVYVL